MLRREFLTRLAALGTGIVVVGPAWLAEVQRQAPVSTWATIADDTFTTVYEVWKQYGKSGYTLQIFDGGWRPLTQAEEMYVSALTPHV